MKPLELFMIYETKIMKVMKIKHISIRFSLCWAWYKTVVSRITDAIVTIVLFVKMKYNSIYNT